MKKRIRRCDSGAASAMADGDPAVAIQWSIGAGLLSAKRASRNRRSFFGGGNWPSLIGKTQLRSHRLHAPASGGLCYQPSRLVPRRTFCRCVWWKKLRGTTIAVELVLAQGSHHSCANGI